MTNFLKFLVVLAPVSALVMYLAILQSKEVSLRMNETNKEFNVEKQQFDKDWYNFSNGKYWKKQGKLALKAHKTSSPDSRALQQIDKQMSAVGNGLQGAMSDAGNSKRVKTKIKKFYVPENNR